MHSQMLLPAITQARGHSQLLNAGSRVARRQRALDQVAAQQESLVWGAEEGGKRVTRLL